MTENDQRKRVAEMIFQGFAQGQTQIAMIAVRCFLKRPSMTDSEILAWLEADLSWEEA